MKKKKANDLDRTLKLLHAMVSVFFRYKPIKMVANICRMGSGALL
jgi:hypothetical protein